MRAVVRLILFSITLFPISAAFAEPQSQTAGATLKRIAQGVEKFTLPNGLRVLFYKRGSAPVFAGQVWVGVGGVNEELGKTGAAHLLEHMAFKGTDKIGTRDYAKEKILLAKLDSLMESSELKGDPKELKSLYEELDKLWVDNEFSRIYQQRGGVGLNAATAKDYTMYEIELPAVAFELWCWMESERLLNPVFRQFYKEREVVREERRMRYDDDPEGQLYEALLATAYWIHPNRLPVIGWALDIKNLSRKDTEHLHDLYYRPDNIVVSVVGDLDFEKSKQLIEKYFGRLVKPDSAIPQVSAVEEEQKGAREAVVRFDAQPQLFVGYHKPVYPNPDDIYFSVLHTLLSSGRSSLLYREFVLKTQLATAIDTTEAPGERFPSLFVVTATPRQGVGTRTLRDRIQNSLDNINENTFSDADVASAVKRVRVGFLGSLDTNSDLASTLAHAELLWGNWQAILSMYDLLNNVNKHELIRLVKTYLKTSNQTFVYIERPQV